MKFDTKLLHAGYEPKEHQMCINVPIYPTTAFDFGEVQRGADLFDLKVEGDIYTRLSNPTNNILEKRLAELEGGSLKLFIRSGGNNCCYFKYHKHRRRSCCRLYSLRRNLQPVFFHIQKIGN